MYSVEPLLLASKEAEENVIAEIITDADNLKYVEDLNSDDFYYKTNQRIFELIKELKSKEKTIDLITLKELGTIKKYDGQALFETLVYMTDTLSFAKNIENTIKIIKNLSMKRKIQLLIKKINKDLAEMNIDKDDVEIKNEVIQEFMELKVKEKNSENEMSKVMIETLKDIENKWKKRDDYSYRTGYLDLDKIIERTS